MRVIALAGVAALLSACASHPPQSPSAAPETSSEPAFTQACVVERQIPLTPSQGLSLSSDQLEGLQLRAQAGVVEAQIQLSQLYQYGVMVPQDPARARSWAQRAADSGEVTGLMHRADLLQSGALLGRDPDQALDLIRRIAERPDAPAQAQWQLAEAYRLGDRLTRDLDQYQLWAERAARHSEVDFYTVKAQMALAKDYSQGDTVPADAEQAFRWYEQAAVNGQPRAQRLLAERWLAGDGAPRVDAEQASCWHWQAAQNGEVASQLYLAEAYQAGRAGVPQDPAQAFELYREVANSEAPLAQRASAEFHLSQAYLHGLGVSADRGLSYRWAQRAAQHGHAKADAFLKALGPRLSAKERTTVLQPSAAALD